MRLGRLLILAVAVVACGVAVQYAAKRFSGYGPIAGHTVPLKVPIPAYTRSLRPNYPYSVVPGGVYSGTELQFADREDPVIKEHYADFNVKNVRMVQLTEDKFQYASYRLHKKIFWTKKRLRIPKGETLLTDGASFARARCGNRLSEVPHNQISDEEPPLKALTMAPMKLGEPMQLADAPPLGDLSLTVPVSIPGFSPSAAPPIMIAVATPPEELTPLTPVMPFVPVLPPVFLPPLPPAIGSNPVPPGTPTIPVDIPPTSEPLVSAVPEPKAVYLFLVTFLISLYGLSRMLNSEESDSGNQ